MAWPWLEKCRDVESGPCLCSPPLLGLRNVIYHGRRRRAGGNFVPTSPLAARIAIQPTRYNFIIPAKWAQRVVYQQSSVPVFYLPPILPRLFLPFSLPAPLLLTLVFSFRILSPFTLPTPTVLLYPYPLCASFFRFSLSLSFPFPFPNFSLSLSPFLFCSRRVVLQYAMPYHTAPYYGTPRHAVSGNNIVLAGSNGGNVWPTLRAKGYANSEDAKGEQAEPLCHAVFTERLFFFLLLILHFHVERLPPPIITTFAPTGADLSSTFVEGLRFDVERHAYWHSSLFLLSFNESPFTSTNRTRVISNIFSMTYFHRKYNFLTIAIFMKIYLDLTLRRNIFNVTFFFLLILTVTGIRRKCLHVICK